MILFKRSKKVLESEQPNSRLFFVKSSQTQRYYVVATVLL